MDTLKVPAQDEVTLDMRLEWTDDFAMEIKETAKFKLHRMSGTTNLIRLDGQDIAVAMKSRALAHERDGVLWGSGRHESMRRRIRRGYW